MTAITFASTGFANIAGAPTVDLGVALYVLHATYFHPIKKSDQPLPTHLWALYRTDDKSFASVGGPSDDGGKSTIARPKTIADGDYALALYPVPSSDGTKAYVTNGEAWVDLEKNVWVDPPPPGEPRLDRRKLLRIPAWTTVSKATFYGGGFKDTPPKSSDFANTGVLHSGDVQPYGTVGKPWEIAIDYGWTHARVKYLFINWKDGKEETVPPGLVVEATTDKGLKLGAGTAIDDTDGTAYVLIAGTKDRWSSLHIGFRAPAGTRVDLSSAASSPDQRLTSDGAIPADRTTRNTLPNLWHSLGMMGWGDPTGSGSPKWGRWDALRKDLVSNASDPALTFHLDDVLVWDKISGKFPKVKADTRVTLFDHLLAIRDPDASLPHLSSTKIGSPYIAARTLFTLSPSPAPSAPTTARDLGTRLVAIEGTFFDLEEKRLFGTPGTQTCVGARAAVSDDHAKADYSTGCSHIDNSGHYELHLITVPSVKDPATSLDLSHGLVYVGSLISGHSAVGSSVSNSFYQLLTQAAVRWSQGHPGVSAVAKQSTKTSPQKDYRVVSADKTKRDKSLVRLRYFFNERTDNKHTFAIQLTVDPKPRSRSFVQGGVMTYYDSAIQGDIVPGGTVQDADGSPAYWHTLAHEFGHVLGLPDEYYEQVDPTSVNPGQPLSNPFLPRFAQYSGWTSNTRPYYTDTRAMMRANQLLRLRHAWHHAKGLSVDPAFAALANRPFVLRNDGYPSGGLEYSTPPNDANNPYSPLATGAMGAAGITIFGVGEDEGLVESMFPTAGIAGSSPTYLSRPPGSRFDAIAVIRTYYRFLFDPTIPSLAQWNAMFGFHLAYYDQYYAEAVRFQLVGGKPVGRIAVVFAPHYACGAGPEASDFSLNLMPTAADPTKSIPSPFLVDAPGLNLTLELPDLSPWPLLRLVLGEKPWQPTADGKGRTAATTIPGASALSKLASTIDVLLGDSPGTRVVQAL